MRNKPGKIVTAALAGMACSLAVAGEGSWYINPMVGWQDFDYERHLDDSATGILGLEYRYGDHWASEIRYLRSSPDLSKGNSDIDLNQYYIDGLYYLQPATAKWQPYGVLGVGYADFDRSEEGQADLGIGTRYRLSERWSLRADARGIFSLDDGSFDQLYSVGISYAFGSGAAPEPQQPAPEMDSDNDGVPDSADQCPSTPAGAAVDSRGCPLDSDGDGVADYKDQCPNTPKGREVDANGCKMALVRDVEVKLNVTFATNSAKIQSDSLANIEKVVEFLNTYPEVPVEIGGHTDNTGSASYNRRLSQRRADAVRDMLVNQYGISAQRITAKGYGEDQPIASNDTPGGRQANRRVVATLKAQVKE